MSTFNAIGTSGTVMLVAGHYIAGDYYVGSGLGWPHIVLLSNSSKFLINREQYRAIIHAFVSAGAS